MKIQIEGDKYFLSQTEKHLSKVRALPAREWKGERAGWLVPIVKESYDAMRAAGFPIEGLPRPTTSAYRVEKAHVPTMLLLRTLGTIDDIQRSKKIPEFRSFDRNTNGWLFKPTKANVQYIKRAFPQAIWEGTAEHIAQSHEETAKLQVERHVARHREKLADLIDPEINDYAFHTKPYDHQAEVFRISRKMEGFALLMEQGTGKTKVIADTAAYNFQQADITGMLVVCPNGVKYTWLEELETHLPRDIVLDVFVWEARTRHKAKDWILRSDQPGERPLRVLIMNVEALSGDIGTGIADLFLSRHGCLMTVDEFTRIKSPTATRTKNCLKLGKKARKRRILSGVPITQGPLDIFSPFKFLDPSILGFNSIFSMRNRHAILGGFQGRQVVGYVKVEELKEKIAPFSYRKLRSECLDLPGKVYAKTTVVLAPKQRELYDEMASEMKSTIDWVDPETPTQVEVMHAIVKIMRLQQIVGGFIPLQDADSGRFKAIPIPGDNPKLIALLDAIEDHDPMEKIVIWAHFRPEIEIINSELQRIYGEKSTVAFYGGTKDSIRQAGRRDFQQNPSGARFFIGQEQAGGVGLTLTASCYEYYYSNGPSLENRLQSEDRLDRISQTRQVVVNDISAKNTCDARLITGYRSKKRLADLITGDPSLSWI